MTSIPYKVTHNTALALGGRNYGERSVRLDAGSTSGTTLTKLLITPNASAAVTGINYHKLFAVGDVTGTTAFGMGDPTKPTVGAMFCFGRTALATGTFNDTALDVRIINKLVDTTGAHGLQGAYIKAKNYAGATLTGDLIGLFVETVADGTVSGSKYGIKIGCDGSTLTADVLLRNGATINNSDANTLTITEATVAIAGALTATGSITTSTGDMAITAGTLAQDKTVSTDALGTVRGIHGQVTTAGAGAISGGNTVGVRGLNTVSGIISAGGCYCYGAQGKLVVTGTMNHADSRLCGLLAQLDTTGATLTTGQLSALWVDMGAGATGAGGGQFNMVRISNTVVGSKPNAMVFMYGDATYAFDLAGGPGGTCSYVVAAGTSSGSFGNADGVASKVIVIAIGGVTYYIPAHTQNT